MRKQVEIEVPREIEGTDGKKVENKTCSRDWGKRFRINEMSAFEAAKLNSKTQRERYEQGALSMLDEWLACVEFQAPIGWVKLLPHDHIEDMSTFTWLYFQVLDVHMGFTEPAAP